MLLVCTRMLLVCTRVLLVCYSYVLVCYSYVTRMYSCVTGMLLVCTRVLLVCYSYVLICTRVYSYVTRKYSYVTRMLLVCSFSHHRFYRVMETRAEVWENEKCSGNTSRRRVFPQLFRVLPNLHGPMCVYSGTFSVGLNPFCF